MARLSESARGNEGERQARIQAAFRRLMLDRLQSYRRGGLSQLGPFHDHEAPVGPSDAFTDLLADASIVRTLAPEAARYLERYPLASLPPDTEDHVYWLETVQSPKPTIQALHQVIRKRPLGRAEGGSVIEVAVLTRQIFATHYVNGSIALTLLVRTPDGQRYMFYTNRVSVDGLGGWFSPVKRYFIERRVRGAARDAFTALTRNIERRASATVE
jgi:hypothetical protein